MRDRAKVAESKGGRFAGGAFVAFDRNLEVTNAAIQQPRDEVGLKAKAVRIRVPAHDIVTAGQRQPVVVTNVMAAREVNEPGESLGDQLPKSRAAAFVRAIRDDQVGLASLTKDFHQRFLRLDIFPADKAIPCPLSKAGRDHRLQSLLDVRLLVIAGDKDGQLDFFFCHRVTYSNSLTLPRIRRLIQKITLAMGTNRFRPRK